MTLHTVHRPPKPSVLAPQNLPPSPALSRSLYRITADQYHLMLEQGILPDGAPTELLHGLVVWKDRGISGEAPMGHSPEHVLVVSLISDLAARINGPLRHLKIQLPIRVSSGDEPEPDAAIIRGQPRDYANRIPEAADVFCIFEVAQTSLERDVQDKLPIYAAANIPQYIIVNLRSGQLEVYSDPDAATSKYRIRTLAAMRGDSVRLN